MSETMVLEWGLKENYKDFKENFKARFGEEVGYNSPILAYNEDDPELAYVFCSEYQLQCFLETVWYRDNYSDKDDMEDSMNNWIIWQFLSETYVRQWPILCPKVKKTSIVASGQRYFRQAYVPKIEPCIHVNIERK